MTPQKLNKELQEVILSSNKTIERIKNTIVFLNEKRQYEILHEQTIRLMKEQGHEKH